MTVLSGDHNSQYLGPIASILEVHILTEVCPLEIAEVNIHHRWSITVRKFLPLHLQPGNKGFWMSYWTSNRRHSWRGRANLKLVSESTTRHQLHSMVLAPYYDQQLHMSVLNGKCGLWTRTPSTMWSQVMFQTEWRRSRRLHFELKSKRMDEIHDWVKTIIHEATDRMKEHYDN